MDSRFKSGGVRQRAQAASESVASSSDAGPRGSSSKKRKMEARNEQLKSTLAQYLIMQWAWGYMSAQEVQRISHCARDDIQKITGKLTTLPDIDTLASLGSEGRYPNKTSKQLRDKYCVNKISEPLHTKMPMLSLSGEFRAAVDQDIFLPHVLFSDIYNNKANPPLLKLQPMLGLEIKAG